MNNDTFRGTLLSIRPIIVSTETYAHSPILGDAPKIARLIGGVESTIFIVPAATLRGRGDTGKEAIRNFRDEFPRIRIIFLANEVEEKSEIESWAAESIYVNQNAFLDENIFNIRSQELRFDAVYNGQMLPFKRHHLASDIRSLCLIYYGNHLDYFFSVKNCLPNATFANGDPIESANGKGNIFRFLSSRDIVDIYASARVGLCLSQREGAMYACGEYLLCGLPVVSTENIGGRNVFLDEYNSVFVDDQPSDVELGMRNLISRSTDRLAIRDRFIQQAREFRGEFFRAIDTIRAENGVRDSDYQSEFMTSIFQDKIWKKRSGESVLTKLRG